MPKAIGNRLAFLLVGLVVVGLLACTLLVRAQEAEPSPANAGDLNSDLLEAASKGDTVAVKDLLAEGADVNAKDKNGGTALFWAAFWGHTAVVEALLAAGADVNAIGPRGETALSRAARFGQTAIVELLKKAGAKK